RIDGGGRFLMPGLIDAHCVAGLAGLYNSGGQAHDQDQLEASSPIQPQLRAIDAYNAREELVAWLRSFGVTTIHTGHGPGALISGQTMLAKTVGDTVEEAMIDDAVAVAATLDPAAFGGSGAPGTRAKAMQMLRSELIKASEYRAKLEAAGDGEGPGRDLKLETLVRVLDNELPLMITAHRAQDIASCLRLAEEFGFTLWLDMATEAYVLTDEIRAANVPVIVHPTMYRATGEAENLSFETAATLRDAGIEVVLQGGYEGYVPKVRVVLYEAAMAAAHGLGFERALESITIGPARLLGIDDRVGSIERGKDADLVIFNGDPFE
ncbi:MAG: amidohydrolase family protein, partial [Planctomycetota bacterium]